ncbi:MULTISPECIES: lytic transglycosylase domain-containing protein [unclassified Frankia]|uniref:lytic transglycosylase domain-containing protein n=1 Tax=unclassified Frankia TaxID=2632575 RepID=UPI00404510D1
MRTAGTNRCYRARTAGRTTQHNGVVDATPPRPYHRPGRSWRVRGASRRHPSCGAPQILVLLVAATCLSTVLTSCGESISSRSASRVPRDLIPLFQNAAAVYGVLTAAQLAAQARVESKFNRDAVSRAGARGMMQFLPGTWEQFGVDGNADGAADPLEPADAILSAARYDAHLAQLVQKLPGDRVSLILAAYNAGPAAVRDAGGVPDFAETRAYVANVHNWTSRFNDQL